MITMILHVRSFTSVMRNSVRESSCVETRLMNDFHFTSVRQCAYRPNVPEIRVQFLDISVFSMNSLDDKCIIQYCFPNRSGYSSDLRSSLLCNESFLTSRIVRLVFVSDARLSRIYHVTFSISTIIAMSPIDCMYCSFKSFYCFKVMLVTPLCLSDCLRISSYL